MRHTWVTQSNDVIATHIPLAKASHLSIQNLCGLQDSALSSSCITLASLMLSYYSCPHSHCSSRTSLSDVPQTYHMSSCLRTYCALCLALSTSNNPFPRFFRSLFKVAFSQGLSSLFYYTFHLCISPPLLSIHFLFFIFL